MNIQLRLPPSIPDCNQTANLYGDRAMIKQPSQTAAAFGGRWTEEKLDILERYLDAYTTALKGQQFELWYIDAFAGTGQIELTKEDQYEFGRFVSGSAERAISIGDKPFDKLVFVERRLDRCAELEALKTAHRNRNVIIENADANSYIINLDDDWRGRRGVLFLDPYATQVKWSTLERIAAFQALDTWILFPVGAISRMLPRLRHPDDVDEKWATRLNTIYGDESWRRLYRESRQPNLFDMDEREPGIDGFLAIYKSKLADLFGDRFLQTSRPLKNSKNSNLFELMFCSGSPNPRAISVSKRIAEYILMKGL